MEQIRTAHETTDAGHDVAVESTRQNNDLRTLKDLELVCVGGGDGGVRWP